MANGLAHNKQHMLHHYYQALTMISHTACKQHTAPQLGLSKPLCNAMLCGML